MLLIHSEYDPIVSVENSRLLYQKLTDTQHQVAYYEIERNGDHGGATYSHRAVLDIIQGFCQQHSHP